MRKYKGLVIGIIVLIALLLVVIGVYIYKKNNDTTIPKDAKCVASIYQGKTRTKHTIDGIEDGLRICWYKYEFYPKGRNKYILQKSIEYSTGITGQYIKPTIVYTKIVKKSDIDKIEQEIQNEINEYNKVTYEYYDDGKWISCNSLQELFGKLF